MGNIPTWRDTAAPDAGTAMQGLNIAGQQITAAGQAASKGLGDFQADSQNDAANALAAASAKYSDANALKAAMANGSLVAQSGANPGALTAAAYGAQDNRVTQLLGQATTGLTNTGLSQTNALNAATQQDKINASHENLAQLKTNNIHTNTDWQDTQNQLEDDLAAKNRTSDIVKKYGSYAEAAAAIANTPDGGDDDIDGGTRAKMMAMLPGMYKQFNPNATDVPAGAQGGGVVGSPTAPMAPGGNAAQSAGQQLASSINPNLGSGSVYTPGSAAALIRKAGGSEQEAQNLGAIAMAESHGDTGAHNTNAKTGDNSYGLWQINMLGKMGPERLAHFGLNSNEDLFNPETNARVALQMSRENGGYNDWSTYKNGLHNQYLGAAAGGAANPDSADNPNILAASKEQNSRAIQALSNLDSRVNQNNASGVQGNYATAMANTTMDMNGAVKQLKTGGFADVPEDLLRQKLNAIVAESKQKGTGVKPVNLATAAAILDRTASQEVGSVNPLNKHFWTQWGRTGVDGDGSAQTAELQKIGQGDDQKVVDDNAGHAATAALLQSAMAAKNAAQNDLFQTQEMARLQPDKAGSVAAKLDIYNRRSQALESLLRTGKNTSNAPEYAKPNQAPGSSVGAQLAASARPKVDPQSAMNYP